MRPIQAVILNFLLCTWIHFETVFFVTLPFSKFCRVEQQETSVSCCRITKIKRRSGIGILYDFLKGPSHEITSLFKNRASRNTLKYSFSNLHFYTLLFIQLNISRSVYYFVSAFVSICSIVSMYSKVRITLILVHIISNFLC